MKKIILLSLFAYLCSLGHAETLKMKDGTLISGSILSQTEYTLNLATSYGNITLNQREIEQILPDKHRLILKGGSQLIGVILDMDEFNLKLQTDDGATVNVDMPQIVSIEVYDYDRGQNAQQEFVEKQIVREQQAAQQAAQDQQVQATGHVEAAGGLTFDSDIDQVFDAKKATVVNGQVQTPTAQPQAVTPRVMTDEEAFLKGVKAGAVSQQEYASAAKQELKTKKEPAPKTSAAVNRVEQNFSKYFAVQAGVMPLDLKLSGDLSLGSYTLSLGDDTQDLGGTSAAISSKFLWRIKESNLWLGPVVGFANVASNSFHIENSSGAMDAKSSGSILQLGVSGNYYLTPKNRFACYITGSALYEMLSVNYHGEHSFGAPETPFNNSISNSGLAASAGFGVETWVDDLMLGLEIRQIFSPRKDELKKSAASSTVIQAQLSWKF